jgi:phosphate-selective porin
MKRALCVAAACAAMLSAGGARAQDSAEPARPAVQYVEGRGAVFRTPDDLFEASLGFNLQVRFTHLDLDAAAGGGGADEFRVRRFKLYLSGFAFDPRLTWRFQAAFENTAANRLLDDAWLNWKFSNAASVQGGEYKTPFTREELYNDGVLQFPERSIAVDGFKPSRDIGVMAAGSFWNERLAYQAGVFGGDGQNSLRASDHVMPVVRLVWNALGTMGPGEADLQNHPKPALSLGASGFHNTLQKISDTAFEGLALNYAGPAGWLGRNAKLFSTGEDVAIQAGGIEAQFKWRGLSAQGEYFVGQARGDVSEVRLYAYGFYGQAGYCILPSRLDVAVRYALVDYDRNVAQSSVSTVSAAATYYFRKNNLKILLDYTRTHRQRPGLAPANDQAFLLQAQLMP